MTGAGPKVDAPPRDRGGRGHAVAHPGQGTATRPRKVISTRPRRNSSGSIRSTTSRTLLPSSRASRATATGPRHPRRTSR